MAGALEHSEMGRVTGPDGGLAGRGKDLGFILCITRSH